MFDSCLFLDVCHESIIHWVFKDSVKQGGRENRWKRVTEEGESEKTPRGELT